MSGIADFLDLMPLTVTVAPFVSRDSYGVATYGTARPYRARVNYKQHYIRKSEGEMVPARGMVWLATSDAISVNDRVTLPDGTTPLILESNGETDETGDTLYVRLDFG